MIHAVLVLTVLQVLYLYQDTSTVESWSKVEELKMNEEEEYTSAYKWRYTFPVAILQILIPVQTNSTMPNAIQSPPTKPILKKAHSDSGTTLFGMDDESSSTRTPAADAAASSSSEYKKVWFDTVAINYHKIVAGDNPAVSQGVPITIGWKAHDHEIVDLECFEATKKPKKNNNNSNKRFSSGNHMKVPVQDRAAILLRNGYSIDQLAQITQDMETIQRQRAESSQGTKWEKLAETSGKLLGRLKRLPLVTSSSSLSSSKNGTSNTIVKTIKVNPAA